MATTLPTVTPVEDSLLLTLYARALDNRLPKPILSPTQWLTRLSARSITTSSNSR